MEMSDSHYQEVVAGIRKAGEIARKGQAAADMLPKWQNAVKERDALLKQLVQIDTAQKATITDLEQIVNTLRESLEMVKATSANKDEIIAKQAEIIATHEKSIKAQAGTAIAQNGTIALEKANAMHMAFLERTYPKNPPVESIEAEPQEAQQ